MKLSIVISCGILISGLISSHVFADGRPNHYVKEVVEVSNHVVFGTDTVVNGATVLIRDLRNKHVDATISSTALESDTAYSIWWAVFNRPQFCVVPRQCEVTDLEINGGDPRIRASVFWAGGFISDSFGGANTTISLNQGRTTRELFAASKDYGLQNLAGSEIHAVLRTHGPVGLAGPLADQVSTANLACPPGGCANVFTSFHPPR